MVKRVWLAAGVLVFTLISSLAAAQPQIQSGKVKLIAITSHGRKSIAPDAPTVAEAGFPTLTLDGLIGLYGPRGIAIDLRERIADSDIDVVTLYGALEADAQDRAIAPAVRI